MYAIFNSDDKILSATMDADPFKFIDKTLGTKISKNGSVGSINEDYYWSIRYKGLVLINTMCGFSDSISDTSTKYMIIDPDCNPEGIPRTSEWDRQLFALTGYNTKELIREIKIISLIKE